MHSWGLNQLRAQCSFKRPMGTQVAAENITAFWQSHACCRIMPVYCRVDIACCTVPWVSTSHSLGSISWRGGQNLSVPWLPIYSVCVALSCFWLATCLISALCPKMCYRPTPLAVMSDAGCKPNLLSLQALVQTWQGCSSNSTTSSATMAPKRPKVNVEEQATKLNLRALALKNKGMKQRIDQMLKDRPDLHSSVLQHLIGMGCADPGASGGGKQTPAITPCPPMLSEEALAAHATSPAQGNSSGKALPAPSPSKGSAGTQCSGASSAASSEGLQLSEEEMALVKGSKNSKLEEWVPRCHMTYGAMTPVYFQYILSKLEPSSLSLAAQRGLCSGKSKHVPKSSLVELFEFITGIAPDADLKPDMHYFPYLVSILQAASQKRGRPAQGMVLPPAWGVEGIYKVTKEEGGLILHHKLLKEKACLPTDFASMVQAEDITFEKNYSESMATLVSGYMRYSCILSFPHAQYKLAVQPPPLKQWLNENEGIKSGDGAGKQGNGADGDGGPEATLASEAPEGPKPKKFKHGQTPAVDENLKEPPAPSPEG